MRQLSWRHLALALLIVLLLPAAASARKGPKKWNPRQDWHKLDGNLEYRVVRRGDRCELNVENVTKRTIEFFEFEFSYQNPRNHQFVTQRRPTYDKLPPKTFFYGQDWIADTTDCEHVTVRVNTIRFAR